MCLFTTFVFEIPRGTRDFTAEEMRKRRYVESIFRNVFELYGYQEIQTPIFEYVELFTIKSGDTILDELYEFTDKGNRRLALRPELTAPVMRLYVDKLQMEPKPIKVYYFGNCFRYDRPQKGRYREFLQAGCELIGTDTPEAIAELIALSSDLLNQIGLSKTELEIGNLNLLSKIFDSLSLTKDQQEGLLPYLDKEKLEDVKDLLYQWDVEESKIIDFIDLLHKRDSDLLYRLLGDDEKITMEINRLHRILELLRHHFFIKDVRLNMGIVRGLDYYTGVVFEVKAPLLGAEKQICGGGEYHLIPLFGGRNTPTAGFALGFDRTLLAMNEEQKSFPNRQLQYYIIPVTEEMIPYGLELASILRRTHKCSCDVDLLRRGMGKALKYAHSQNTCHVVILGPREMENNMLTIRNMETGDQSEVPIDQFKMNPHHTKT
ncbi:MAG: histidine--tRNA ligase [Candidatus Thermoplasmatota archaeon]|nr:histidine--tRNA ligase [Candidatus Thermoplasmatota archaeon]